MIRNFILESAGLQRVLRDEEQLEAYIRHATVGVWHCSCSCRMGSEDDPMAVTSPSGQVRGVHGLRVVDASIFPMIPCANTNFPTMMVAEKIADDIVNAEQRCIGVPSRNRDERKTAACRRSLSGANRVRRATTSSTC